MADLKTAGGGLRFYFTREVLLKVLGQSNKGAWLRYYLQRSDGDFDGSDGAIYTTAQVTAKNVTAVYIEEPL